MRTKTLLLAAAALSAGILASSAQVYSANVVGYVNTVFKPGQTLFSNPLKNTTNNLNTLIPSGPDGMTISRWSNTDATFLGAAATFYVSGADPGPGTWSVDPAFGSDNILPGEGLFLLNPGATFTNTFVGDVLQGADIPLTVPAGTSLLASMVPIGGNITNVLAQLVLDPDAGCTVSTFDTTPQNWSDAETYYGVATPGGWSPATLQINVGEGFYMFNAGAATVWHRSFTVQ